MGHNSNIIQLLLFLTIVWVVDPCSCFVSHHHRQKTEELIRGLERKLASGRILPSSSPAAALDSTAVSAATKAAASEKKKTKKKTKKSRSNHSRPNRTQERVFHPANYGADPTGVRDSTDGIIAALNDAVKVGKGLQMLPRLTDLGGVIIDLDGGNYSLSRPIRFPSGIGNLVFTSGTLRAMDSFDGQRYLVELQSDHPPPQNVMSYEDITFRDVLFDSRNRSGGLIIAHAARVRVTNCFFLHFPTTGIFVQNGHEAFISNSFLGYKSTVGSDPAEKTFIGTAINLSGNDHAITDLAIFSAATGILVNSRANIITGVHCYNKASVFGGVGIDVNVPDLSQTRIINCYMDYTGIRVRDPVQVVIADAFFLGDANIVIQSRKGVVSGLTIVNNLFSGTNKPTVQLNGAFNTVNQVMIDANNVNGGMILKSTVARQTVQINNAKVSSADFSSMLVFPNLISQFQYSFYTNQAPGKGRFPVFAVTSTSNNVVAIESDRAAQGTLSIEVRQ